MKMNKFIWIFTFLFVSLTACKDKEREVEEIDVEEQAEAFEEDLEELRQDDGIVVAIESNPELSTFATGINAWNIGDQLNDENGPFTVFAPTNAAYSWMYRDQGREVLRVNNDAIIEYHIVEGKMTADELKEKIKDANGELQLDPMGEGKLTLTMEGDQIILKDSSGDKAIILDSYVSDHGVIHTIDKVLVPVDFDVEITVEK